MLTNRVAWQLQLWGETYIELVIVPKRYIRNNLQSIACVFPIFKVIIPNNHLLKRRRTSHHKFEHNILNFNLTSFVVCGFHNY